MNCLNCSTKIAGNFCYECGQKTEDLRYTLRGLVKDLFFSALHLEKKGLPSTIARLTTEPGKAIRQVLEGQRQSLYPPFKYLVLIGAIIIIFSLRYRFFHNEYTQIESNDMHVLPEWILLSKDYQIFIESFFQVRGRSGYTAEHRCDSGLRIFLFCLAVREKIQLCGKFDSQHLHHRAAVVLSHIADTLFRISTGKQNNLDCDLQRRHYCL